MAYDPNIPQATDLLSQSQSDIQSNFAALKVLIDINHETFGNAQEGKHKYVELPVQTPSPPIAFAAGEVALYSFLNATTTKNELYINKTNQATVVQVPATASILSTNSNPGLNVAGWTYLPSGILMKWGSGSANGNTAFTFPVAATIPVFTNVMSMQLCTAYSNIADGDGFVRLSTFTNLGFTAFGSARTTVTTKAVMFQYLAIGY